MATDYKKISQFNEEQLGKDRASRMSQVAMYADTAHFVYELLQNADDAGATEIQFRVSDEKLVVEHNGTPFTEDNVKAISYFGKGKTDITKIGHFGLGFKSVFAYTAAPCVHSGAESFEITQLYSVAATRYPNDLKRGRTRFVLPFDHLIRNPNYIECRKLKPAKNAYEEIVSKLANLGAGTLLFTKSLMEIKWEAREKGGHYLREDTTVDERAREIYIITGDSKEHCFLVFDRSVAWKEADGEDKAHRPVQIAFALNKRLAEDGTIEAVEEARLFVFFPTDKETHVGFILQGPYRTTPARDNIPSDDDFNRHLVQETAALLADSLQHIKKLKLLNLVALNTLPINHDKFKEGTFFHPLHSKVRDALANHPLLPSSNRGYVSGAQAKLARGAELTKIFGPSQLDQLFDNTGLKWLVPELTQNNYPVLHQFLVGKKTPVAHFQRAEWIAHPLALNIEVGAEQIGKLITAEFMSQQIDQWVIRFYEYLSDMGSANRSFTSQPIIRLEGDKHVVPLGANGTPNAFLPIEDEDDEAVTGLPTVKRSLVQKKEIRQFLEEDIGLTTPDFADLVLKKVLPKYTRTGDKKIHLETWQRDFRKITQALQTDSHEKKSRLENALEEARYLLAQPIGNEEDFLLVKAQDAYFNTEENKLYFVDCKGIYLLAHEPYSENDLSALAGLGVAKSPRFKKKSANYQGYVSLIHYHGWHKRGLDGFDPDWELDGLESVVNAPTLERSRLLWEYLLPHAQCIRGVVEKSSRQTFENAEREEVISANGKLLLETPWLPDKQGVFHTPGELGLDDLPEVFLKSASNAMELSEKLGMKQPEQQQALQKLGQGDPRRMKLLEKIASASDSELDAFEKLVPKKVAPQPAPPFKDAMKGLTRLQRGEISQVNVNASPLTNPIRYEEKLRDGVQDSIKTHLTSPQTVTFSPVRNQPTNSEARKFLYSEYQGKCQVTGDTFPKASANAQGVTENYFEACALLSYTNADYLNDAGNMLCVSADTMAKLKNASFEWLDDIEAVIEKFKQADSKLERVEARVQLAGKECVVTWSQRHFMRLVALWEKA